MEVYDDLKKKEVKFKTRNKFLDYENYQILKRGKRDILEFSFNSSISLKYFLDNIENSLNKNIFLEDEIIKLKAEILCIEKVEIKNDNKIYAHLHSNIKIFSRDDNI